MKTSVQTEVKPLTSELLWGYLGRCPYAEAFFKCFIAVIENLVQAATDSNNVSNAPKQAERQAVVHEVYGFYTIFYLAEMVLVMPETIRAESLLIYEKMWRVGVGYLRYPAYLFAKRRTNSVGDDGTRVYDIGYLVCHLEVQPWWRNDR